MSRACRKAVFVAPALALLAGCGGGEEAGNRPGAEANRAESAGDARAVNGTAARPQPPSPTPEPVFTSLARSDCTLTEENREEAGYARFVCPGRGDYRLEIVEADGRVDLAVIRGADAARPLQLSSKIAKGAFSHLGDTAQWIGSDRLIARYRVEQPDGRAAVSSLIVIDLQAACPIATVPPGPGQNEQALELAKGQGVCIRN